jgi:hypothetical protein
MTADSIVQEVRAARAAIAGKFGYDLPKYLAWAREQTKLRKEAGGNLAEGVKVPAATRRRARTPGAAGE